MQDPMNPTPKNPTLDDVLEDRGATYGHFIDQAHCAQQFRQTLQRTLEQNDNYRELSLEEKNLVLEGLGMVLHKVARLANGDPRHVDSYVDIAGYATVTCKYLNGGRS